MRSTSEKRKLKYTSARDMVEKRAAGFTAPYLKMPDGAQLFKPKAGVMLLDILPYKAGEGNPYAEAGMLHWERTMWVHRGVGANSESHLCPRKNSKQPCPICEYRARLEKEGDEDTDELRQSLNPKERQLFNVINRKEPDKGVQLWDFSFHLFGKLLQARIRDSDEDDNWDLFFTLDKGFTLKVGFGEKTYAGRAYFEAETIDFKVRAEPYEEDILESVHCLDEILVQTDYEELKKTFQESNADPGSPQKGKRKEEEEDEEEEKPRRKVKDVRGKGDEDEVEEPEDEEEEETPKPKKGKKKEEEEDGFEDFEDFEDDEKPKKKGKKEPEEDEDEEEPAPKKKKSKDAEEEEDEPEDEEEPEEEDEEPKPKKGKRKVEEEDEEEEPAEEDEDEEEPHQSKKRGKFNRQKGDKGWDD